MVEAASESTNVPSVPALPLPSEEPVPTGPIKFGVYTIYSEQPLDDIRTFLETFTDDKSDVGMMRIDHVRDDNGEYKETHRTLVCLHPRVYAHLCLEGHNKRSTEGHDFRIAPYEIRQGNHPPKDCGYALYIRLPLDVLTFDQCKTQLVERMKQFQTFNLLSRTGGDYALHYPTFTREEKVAERRGYAIVTLNHQLDKDACATIKVVLDQTKWWDSDGKPHLCRVSWCKKAALNELRTASTSRSRAPKAASGKDKSFGFGRSAPKPAAKKAPLKSK